jgi:hypothetical protein
MSQDPESCVKGPDWGIALRPDRVVVGDARAIPSLLEQLESRTPAPQAPAWLSGFRPFQDDQIVALVFPVPRTVPSGIEHPVLRALFRSARDSLRDVTHVQLGARTGGLSGGIELAIELAARDADAAVGIAGRWRALQEAARAEWTQVAPGLASWHEALEIENKVDVVHANARRSLDAVADVAELTSEWMILASRDFRATGTPGPAHEGSDEIDPWPQQFRNELPVATLQPYRPEAPLAGKVDAISGPFGIRVERVTYGASPEIGLEIELRGAGPEIPNLVEPLSSPRLFVTTAVNAAGQDLLREESCGPDPNPAPARLLREPLAKRVLGTKTIRLRPGVSLDEIEQLEGRVELDLPVRTERVWLGKPHTGQSQSVAGATFELTSATPNSFSYRLRGDTRRVLQVRGLDARGQPLASRESWETDLLLAEGRVGTQRCAGKLASVEVIFTTELQSAQYEFALDSARPSTDDESLQTESAAFISFSKEQYDEEFGGREGPPWPRGRQAKSLAAAGPFTVALEALTPGEVVEPRLTVLAPRIPNLTYNVTGLELALRGVGLRDGSASRAQRSERPASGRRTLMAAGYRFGRDDLESTAQIDTGIPLKGRQVAHIDGNVVLRLPHAVRALELPAEPGRSVSLGDATLTLVELVRNGFTLRLDGPPEELFSVQAFGSEDQELYSERASQPVPTPASAKELRFRVHGRPHRILVQGSLGHTTARYAFRIEIPEEVPAAPVR